MGDDFFNAILILYIIILLGSSHHHCFLVGYPIIWETINGVSPYLHQKSCYTIAILGISHYFLGNNIVHSADLIISVGFLVIA